MLALKDTKIKSSCPYILLISVPQYPIWNGYPKRLKRHKNEKQTIQGYFEHKPLDRFPMMKGKDTND